MLEISLLKFTPDKLKEFKKSEIIFKEGSSGTKMYVIFSGRIRLFTEEPGREVTLALIGPGEFFGEMALIDESPRSATAVADEDSTLLVLDQSQFFDLIKSSPDFAFLLIQNLSKRLRERWDLYDKLKSAEPHKNATMKLVLKPFHLDEFSNALNFLQNQIKKDRLASEMKIISNVKQLITPYIEKLAASRLDSRQREWLSVIESNLNQIIAPFIGKVPLISNLTPAELQIADLIKDGRTSKEISSLLNLSTTTIDFHRNNIRSKLGLKNQKTSLRVHLLNLSREE